MSRALQIKDEGNRHFQKGDYTGAESLYSQAYESRLSQSQKEDQSFYKYKQSKKKTLTINPMRSIIADPKNATLYTNRAMARLKLSQWDSVIADCETVLALPAGPSNIKAHYYLAQAQLALGGDPSAALASALCAHRLCAATNDKSLAAVTALTLLCKKAQWEAREKRRTREEHGLEGDMLRLLKQEREADVAAAREYGGEAEAAVVEEEGRLKEERMRDVFERSRRLDGSGGQGKREVPDWAIDDISFGFMVDPVIVRPLFPFLFSFFFFFFLLLLFSRLEHCTNLSDKNRQIIRTSVHHRTPPPTPQRSPHPRTPPPIRSAAQHGLAAGLRGFPKGKWLGCGLVVCVTFRTHQILPYFLFFFFLFFSHLGRHLRLLCYFVYQTYKAYLDNSIERSKTSESTFSFIHTTPTHVEFARQKIMISCYYNICKSCCTMCSLVCLSVLIYNP